MITSHKVPARQSEREAVRPTGPTEGHVTLVTLYLITYISGRESVTLRTEWGIGVDPLPQNVIQSTTRAVHPFYPDVDRAPAFLELRPQKLGHAVRQIERSAIPEVQARPHAIMVGEGSK